MVDFPIAELVPHTVYQGFVNVIALADMLGEEILGSFKLVSDLIQHREARGLSFC